MLKRGILPFLGALCLPVAAMSAPQGFATPQAALDAMIAATEAQDHQALLQVFGPEAEDLLFSGDATEDASNRSRILDMYRAGYRFVPGEDGAIIIDLGYDDWPFPIPLVQTGDSWSFDIAAGREEVLSREIGLNELNVMELIEAYGEVQADFRQVDQDGDGVLEFASSIISTADARSGLFWPGGDSPVGELFARASLDGFSDGTEDHVGEPYDGYFFRVLDAQGDHAPGGAMGYVVNGNMVAGHAILAVPYDYGITGVHSFMMAENGILLQADLGEDTLDQGFDMTVFDPDDSWTPVGSNFRDR
jgi:hypothetical protein